MNKFLVFRITCVLVTWLMIEFSGSWNISVFWINVWITRLFIHKEKRKDFLYMEVKLNSVRTGKKRKNLLPKKKNRYRRRTFLSLILIDCFQLETSNFFIISDFLSGMSIALPATTFRLIYFSLSKTFSFRMGKSFQVVSHLMILPGIDLN